VVFRLSVDVSTSKLRQSGLGVRGHARPEACKRSRPKHTQSAALKVPAWELLLDTHVQH
jgi:hypothetical protein